MRRTLLVADLDPKFEGWAGAVDGKMICVAPPGFLEDAGQRQSMRDVVRRTGGDCKECGGCQLSLGA